MQEWRECDFENINPEHLRTQTTEYLKTIHQIERGLPVNSVTLSLKEKVEEMKEKVSVITYLRSPAMKSHHWDLIEGVLQQKITTGGPLTLKILEKFNVFTFHEAIQKISNQASSENKLEVILKRCNNRYV
ncbi:dynein axonemal heavy chain 6-like [Tachypleus tridentatus]|uniref:dynein axonemal heavy chain 6-like n=1 Tax=Tachypleus tridentatus TaxID=6853 RepID=UPI003FD18203